jgi:very-short-patch-repair endonuclease
MNSELRRLLNRNAGVITLADVYRAGVYAALKHALHAGALARIYPGVYAEPRALRPRTLMQAAVAYTGGQAALSHVSALSVLGLHEAQVSQPVHVSGDQDLRLRYRSTSNALGTLVVHRSAGFAMEAPAVLVRDGLPVTSLERSIVDSWPLLDPADRRAPVIEAVSGQRTRPDRIRAVLDQRPHLADRATLSHVLHLLEIGCHSALEMWGFEHVFTGPGMPDFRRQVPVMIGHRTVYLDLLAEDEMVNIELDGHRGHHTRADRERDLKRDAALNRMGFLVVRFTQRRLRFEIPSVRQETLDILGSRRGMRSLLLDRSRS